MGKIIAGSVTLGFKGIGKKGDAGQVERTQWDMKAGNVLLIQLISTLGLGVIYFVVCTTAGGYGVDKSLLYSLVGMVISFILCFLFTPIAAEAIAIVGVNPVSGMTLVTVVIGSLVMAGIGLFGKPGAFVALIVGVAVCTALSTSGALISDFKTGYWIGATPRSQQVWKFLGLAVAALVVAFVIPLMDQSYHFLIPGTTISNEEVLPAPQANMIGAVVKGLMGGGEQPYILYGLGAFIAILAYMAGLPPLAFALGMYLHISITFPQLVGGFVAWLVGRSGKTAEVRQARANQGTLIASGMMAGAAIVGIVAAVMRLPQTNFAVQYVSTGIQYTVSKNVLGEPFLEEKAADWFAGATGQGLGLAMFLGLIVVTFLLARWGAGVQLREEAARKE
jgi:putative OPT family oligopeptide transporter